MPYSNDSQIKPQLIEFGLNPNEWLIEDFNEDQARFTNSLDPEFIFLGTFEKDEKKNLRIHDMQLLSF
jgi:hypothetical protein